MNLGRENKIQKYLDERDNDSNSFFVQRYLC